MPVARSRNGWGRVQGSGFGVQGRVQGSGFRVRIIVVIFVSIFVDNDRDNDYDNDVRPVDDYGDDYGLRGEALASSTVIVAVIVNRNGAGLLECPILAGASGFFGISH